jgi:acyl-coenzyme A synthetase/AMP-(fatty) acid ligase
LGDVQTIRELLAAGEAHATALLAPERPPLVYSGLREQIERSVATLNRLGLGRNDRIALVLPNGPEMAAAFPALAAGATTAPLNPAYRAEEYRFYLSDLDARALVVERGSDSAALAVAEALGIPRLELWRTPEAPAG